MLVREIFLGCFRAGEPKPPVLQANAHLTPVTDWHDLAFGKVAR